MIISYTFHYSVDSQNASKITKKKVAKRDEFTSLFYFILRKYCPHCLSIKDEITVVLVSFSTHQSLLKFGMIFTSFISFNSSVYCILCIKVSMMERKSFKSILGTFVVTCHGICYVIQYNQ